MSADAYLHVGLFDKGLTIVNDSLANLSKDTKHFCEAELNRLKGELFLKLEPSDETTPEKYFLQAIDIAKEQEAKSLATMSLSRLWQKQGKVTEAQQELSSVYNWFTKGFDNY